MLKLMLLLKGRVSHCFRDDKTAKSAASQSFFLDGFFCLLLKPFEKENSFLRVVGFTLLTCLITLNKIDYTVAN